ncbi:MAG: phosphoglycolate phosphatase, partial [Duodenibacillus sp.]|nr:phosphoglycolate phosphatase [Duodenibacillus sp.]
AGVRALLVRTGYNEGEPAETWAPANGFGASFADTAAAVASLMA